VVRRDSSNDPWRSQHGIDTLTNNGPAHVLGWVMKPISYARHRFPPDVIRHAVWLYLRFTLSYRDAEDLLAERGLMVSNESIRRWVLKFGPIIAKNLRESRPKPHCRWHLDEMVASIAGRQMYMWRAVDSEGEVLEILVQSRRDKAAALRLLRKLLRRQGFVPTVIVTDKLRSYGAALREIGFSGLHEQGLRANNRAENSHQPLRRRERARICAPLPKNAGRTGTSQRPNSKRRGSKAARNSSIRTAKRTSKLSVNRIRSGIAISGTLRRDSNDGFLLRRVCLWRMAASPGLCRFFRSWMKS
jgi:putative transposase